MVIVLMLVSSLLAGDRLAEGQSWVHMVAFAVTMALVLYVILDLEFPRVGFVRLDAYDQVLVDVRESMR
jgi:hypothetical protein